MEPDARSDEVTIPDRPVSKPFPMAPGGAPNTLTLMGIGLSTLCGKPGAWELADIDGAYVMVRQETHRGGLITGPRGLSFGRSTMPGWVVEVPEDKLDEPVPATREANYSWLSRSDLMLLLPDERYVMFWSTDREHFMFEKQRVQAGEVELASVPGAITFEFTPLVARSVDDYDLIPWLLEEGHLDERRRDILATHLLNPARGYVRHSQRQMPVAQLDVTPEPLRALFVAEFLEWYAQMAVQRSGEHLVALHRARSLIEAAKTGAKDAIMEARVSETYAQQGTPEREVFEKYRVYAWKCAVGGVTKDLFLTSLPTRLDQVSAGVSGSTEEPDLDWERTAFAIRLDTLRSKHGCAEHPGIAYEVQNAPSERERTAVRMRLLLGNHGLSLLSGYFDLYSMGRRSGDTPIEGRGSLLGPLVDDCEEDWEKTRNQLLQASCEKLLRKAPYPQVLIALLQHSHDSSHRLTLLERYLDACASSAHPWWRSLSGSDDETASSVWKHLAPCVKWLAELLKGTGKTLSGMVERRLTAYSLAMHEANELLNALFRHEVVLSGTTLNPSVHYLERVSDHPATRPNFRAHVNVRNGELTITRDVPVPEAPHTRVVLQLLQRVGDETPDFVHGPPQNPHAYKLATDIRDSYAIDLVVPADLAELKQRHTLLPKGFAECAEALNLARAAVTIVDNLRNGTPLQKTMEPAWEMFKGVVALADSHQAVLKAMARPLPITSFARSSLNGLKLASATVGAVDGAWKVVKGGKILFSEEGELEYELRHGRSVRAAVQATKGALQIVGGIAGIVAAVPSTAALAATPMGLLIIIGSSLICVTLDVLLDYTRELGDGAHRLEQAVDKAQREELHQRRSFRVSVTTSNACRRAVDDWRS